MLHENKVITNFIFHTLNIAHAPPTPVLVLSWNSRGKSSAGQMTLRASHTIFTINKKQTFGVPYSGQRGHNS